MSSSVSGDYSTSNLKDRNWKGEGCTFSPQLAKKPTEKSRRCTDFLCCILFVAFIGCMAAATIYGYINGHPGEFIAPIDGQSRVCGYSDGVKDYPNLYVVDIVAAADTPKDAFKYGVCVKGCPENSDSSVECVTTDQESQCSISGQTYGTSEVFNYCVPEYDSLPQAAKDNWQDVQDNLRGSSYGSAVMDLYESR